MEDSVGIIGRLWMRRERDDAAENLLVFRDRDAMSPISRDRRLCHSHSVISTRNNRLTSHVRIARYRLRNRSAKLS